MKKKSVTLGAVILFWISAVLWCVNCAIDLSQGQLRGMDPILAILWLLIAIKWTRRYLAERKKEDEDEL